MVRHLRIDLPIEEIIRRYVNGKSINSLAIHYGVSRGTITKRLIRANVKLRTHSQAECVKWSHMTKEQRMHQVKAAHDAVRGKPHPRNIIWNIPITPTEQRVIDLIKQRGWSLIYCGQGGVVINGCNPDFIHRTKKKVIEVWTGVKHEDKAEKYVKAGFRCLFVNLKYDAKSISAKNIHKIEQFLAN